MKNILVSLLILLASNLHAQDTVRRMPDLGRLDSIQSVILKEKRLIQVFLPEDYKPGTSDKYDVLYVLDGGNWNTGLITRVQSFVEGESYMPPTIIVSILGIDRNKDLTPTSIEGWKTSGGAATFLGFIKEELIPYINKTYPSNGDNTLWGHSLGGLFVVNALLNEPQLFKSYIAVDPSLWWDKCYIQRIAPYKLSALADLSNTLYISGRGGKESQEMQIDSMNTILQKFAPASLKWKSVSYPDETHSSIRLKTIYDGLKFSYGWNRNQIEFHPMNGMLIKDKPVKIWYFTDTSKVRYTLDGTVPTIASAGMVPEISIADATKITVKQFSHRARYDKVKTGEFIAAKALRPVPKPKNAKAGGFHYDYYEGEELKQSGIANEDFGDHKLPRKNNYKLVIDGLMETEEAGYYLFVLDADKGSKLYLNNRLLITWDGSYVSRTFSYILPLEKGFYNLRLEYLHTNKDFQLKLAYLTPGDMNSKNPLPLPFKLEYSLKD